MAYPTDFSALANGFLNTTRQATAGSEGRSEAGTHAAHHNALAGAVNLLEQTVGLRPAGVHASVAARLGVIDLGVDWSAGDDVRWVTAGVGGAPGQLGRLRHGTAARPVTVVGPTFKASRTGAVTQANLEAAEFAGADGGDQLAAIMGISYGTAGEEVQGVGVAGFAKTSSTAGSPGNDACGGYFGGRALIDSVGAVGIGIYVQGRRDTDASQNTALELSSFNGGSEGVLNVTGASSTKGIWACASGPSPSAAAFQIGNPFSQQWLVGVHANAQVRSTVGGIRDAFLRDDSTAHKSLLIRGTHDEGAIVVERDAGPVIVGASALTVDTLQLLELNAGGISRNPIMRITAGGSGVATSVKFNNPAGNFFLGQSGGVDNFMTGTVAGDGAFYVDGTRKIHLGRTGSRSTLRVGDNVGIGQGSADSVAGMVGGMFLANVVTRPTGIPIGGGLLYPDNGVLKWMGPSGTVTQLGAA